LPPAIALRGLFLFAVVGPLPFATHEKAQSNR